MFSIPSSPDEKIKWDSTKKDFITFVEIYELAGGLKLNGKSATADQIGELFLNVIELDILPFPDFKTMRIALDPKKDAIDAIEDMAVKLKEAEELEDMLDEINIEPSKEEQARKAFGWIMANDFVRKLGRYVQFS